MIHLSKAAAREIIRLRAKHSHPTALFRLGIEASGCSGFSYTMGFDETANPDDRVHESEGIQVVVATQYLQYLSGLTLDYSEDLMGGGFRFNNPNASLNCSCGNSFAVNQS